MSSCPLTPPHLEALLADRLDAVERQAIAEHLSQACDDCGTALLATGLDEETLLALLAGAGHADATADAASLERSWQDIDARLPQPRRLEAATEAVAGPRRWSWLFGGGFALAAAAAGLLLVAQPDGETPSVLSTGIKGSAALPVASVELLQAGVSAPTTVDESAVVVVRYSLEREAHVVLWHWRIGQLPQRLYDGRLPAGERLAVPATGGELGYGFDGEPGGHLFVLMASDVPLTAAQSRNALDEAWHKRPPENTEIHIGDLPVRVSATRVGVRSGLQEK